MASFNKSFICLLLIHLFVDAKKRKNKSALEKPKTEEQDNNEPKKEDENKTNPQETDTKVGQAFEVKSPSGIAHMVSFSTDGYFVFSFSVDSAKMDEFLKKYKTTASKVTFNDTIVYAAITFHPKTAKNIQIEDGKVLIDNDPGVIGGALSKVGSKYLMVQGNDPTVLEALNKGGSNALFSMVVANMKVLSEKPELLEVPAEGASEEKKPEKGASEEKKPEDGAPEQEKAGAAEGSNPPQEGEAPKEGQPPAPPKA